jgi:tetratricopeptide (TPR) repeat protein
MARDPVADKTTLLAVNEAARAGHLAHAAGLAEAALADGLEHALLFNVLAVKLEQQGRLADAERLLQRAVRLAPTDLGARNALGLCLLRLDRFAEALAHFDALVELQPGVAYVHVNHGNALLGLGRVSAAEASFGRALALDPQHGVALAGLAHIASRRGAYPAARSRAERALAVLPGYPDAVMSLAAAELGEGAADRAEERIRVLLADSRLSPTERAHANGLRGDILDASNRTMEAFGAYTECNEALRRVYADRFVSGASALDYVREMTRYFAAASPQAWKLATAAAAAAAGPGTLGHVFLIGFPRSGTTLLEVILEGHPDVVSLEERELLIDGVHQFMRRPDDLDTLLHAAPQTLDAMRAAYWRRVAAEGAQVSGKVLVDKYPLNSLKLPMISRLFPNAKILFACRDPRDVVLSCFRHRFNMSAPLYEVLSIDGAARYYDAVMGLVLRLNGLLTMDICLVRHEDLVTEFAREMKRICGFLNLAWTPAMGDFALRTQYRGVLTPSTAQLARGLNTEGLGHWRRYRPQLAPVLPLLEPWVKQFYYEP